ncbi:hypothetical protein F4810DRAFT_83207 [Camillea tinctor]|nr:hypothetical protein F4810DRAFT_83207 [Camillea tinctor]
MKGSRSVCALCRHRVAIVGQVRSPQTQPSRASPFSTTTTTQAETTSTTDQPEERPLVRKFRDNTPDRRVARLRASQNYFDRAGNSSDLTANLFQQIVQEQKESQNGPMQPASLSSDTSIEIAKAVTELEEMVKSNKPVAEAYVYLKTKLYPLVQQPGAHLPLAFTSIVSRLLEKIRVEKKADMLTGGLPAVADIFRTYADIGDLRPTEWADLVGHLIRAILDIGVGYSQQPEREALLMDLVESWKVLSSPQDLVPYSADDNVRDGWSLSKLERYHLTGFARNADFIAAVDSLFPRYYNSQLGTPVAILAIATYTILLDGQRTSAEARKSAHRFLVGVANIITFVPIPEDKLRREIAETFPHLEKYIMDQWSAVKSHLKARIQSAHLTSKPQAGRTVSQIHRGLRITGTANIEGGLSDALRKRRPQQVNKLWDEFVGSGTTMTKEKAAELCQQPELFDSFVYTRMALKQPDEALKTLDVMNMIKLKPTIKTWTRMLDGCRVAGNGTAIKNIWTKLTLSGMQFDPAIWTSRIAGLIDSGDIRAGIQALEEMTRLGKADPKTRSRAAIEPTIEPVNAAIAGMIQRNHLDVAEKLLAWATKEGIKPDVVTFNTMLRAFIRNSRDDDVRKLFDTMKVYGVQADAATFTIVLDAAFSKYNPASPQEQEEIVSQALSEMEAAGLEINLFTYGKMVYLLLQSESATAANALIEHIWTTEKKLSPHIYTMLAEYYFSLSPPDIKAVNQLVERRESFFDGDLDRVFYDRLVQGYAAAGDPDVALRMFYHVMNKGEPVSLGSQAALLTALLRQSRLPDAKMMVDTTRTQALQRYGKDDTRFWNHHFWCLARDFRLIDPNTDPIHPNNDVSKEEETSPAAP